MSKKGMKRFEDTHSQSLASSVPEIQGKAKHGKEPARPIIADTKPPEIKVYHSTPHKDMADRPISEVYAEIDNDLARDNLENDITAADLQDLQ